MYFPDDPSGSGTNTGPGMHCVGRANNDSPGAETGNGIYSVVADCSVRVYRNWIGSQTGYHKVSLSGDCLFGTSQDDVKYYGDVLRAGAFSFATDYRTSADTGSRCTAIMSVALSTAVLAPRYIPVVLGAGSVMDMLRGQDCSGSERITTILIQLYLTMVVLV